MVRGDGVIVNNGFKYASELIEFVRNNFLNVAIYVAGYPEKDSEIEFLRNKVELGVNACITQICFNVEKIYNLKSQVKIPILPGLIFPTDKSISFAKKLGLDVPIIDDPADFLKSQIQNLIQKGFNHIHFYTLNNLSNLSFLFYDNI